MDRPDHETSSGALAVPQRSTKDSAIESFKALANLDPSGVASTVIGVIEAWTSSAYGRSSEEFLAAVARYLEDHAEKLATIEERFASAAYTTECWLR